MLGDEKWGRVQGPGEENTGEASGTRRGIHPAATEEQQAQYCRRVVEAGQGLMAGWLNWGLFDAPEATDPSQFSGLLTAEGKPKTWGRTFSELASRQKAQSFTPRVLGERPTLDWNKCLVDAQAAAQFRQAYFEAFRKDIHKERAP